MRPAARDPPGEACPPVLSAAPWDRRLFIYSFARYSWSICECAWHPVGAAELRHEVFGLRHLETRREGGVGQSRPCDHVVP